MCEKLIDYFYLKKTIQKPTKKLLAMSAFVIVLSVMLSGCASKTTTVNNTHFLMDTVVNIEAFGKDKDALNKAVNDTFSDMQILADKFDRYNKRSDVTKINQKAGEKPVTASYDVIFILDFLQKQQNNQVDITIGPLIDLWNASKEQSKIPDKTAVDTVKRLMGLEKVIINGDNKSVFLTNANMSLDFGAVAKGYIVEQASRKMAENKDVSYAIINGGGNIKTIGQKDDKKPWRIGVQDPLDKNKLIGILNLGAGKAVATSGDYQRFFEVDGKRYHHILDVKTGYPSDENISVTVICNDAFLADFYSTLLFIMPLDEAILLAKQQNIQAIFVHKDKKIYLSEDLKGMFEKNEQNNWQYVQK